MTGIVIRDFARLAHDKLAALQGFGVSTIHEAQGRIGLLDARLRPIFPGSRIAGSAITMTVAPGDNTMFHVAVELCRAGDILIATPTSSCTDGYFGELLATSLRARGAVGLVLDAGCRDIRDLTKMGFPVWSRAIHAQGTVKETLGDVNLPIVCAGQAMHAGDAIVADDDGVVVVRYADVGRVIDACTKREEREAANRLRFEKGEIGLDVYGMREKLRAKGLTYFADANAFSRGESL